MIRQDNKKHKTSIIKCTKIVVTIEPRVKMTIWQEKERINYQQKLSGKCCDDHAIAKLLSILMAKPM